MADIPKIINISPDYSSVMPYELSEIKTIRKRFGLTQSELAKKANVSQSLIAKIEAGKIDPTYSKAREIFNFLDSLREEHELKAWQVMHPSIISIKPYASITEAISKMKKHGISQMPVMSENKCIGIISETSILKSLLDKKASAVNDIMEDAPPIVSKNTSINAISELLRHMSLVIVADKGRMRGIITKSDILGKLKSYRKI